jgi:phosphatidylserine/phosphatidylglycerophosphate/cardiolipin synthase-like enzyme
MHGGPFFSLVWRAVVLLRRFGVPAALARMDAGTARGSAAAVAYLLRARAWTVRHRQPRWSGIEAAWRRGAAVPVAPLDDGDTFRLIAEGAAAFDERAALYASAASHIDIATYYIQADATGWSTVRALAAAAARGVRVRLLLDDVMTFRKAQEVAGMDALLAEARRAGIAVKTWRDPRRPYDSNHRKMIVVDDRAALVGGRNFADHYRGSAWRDVDLLVEGPSVRPLARLFDAVWTGAVRTPAAAPWVDHVPASIAADPIMRAVLAAIRGARRRIDLELSYFVALNPLCDALTDAARRGVRVRLLTNSAESTDLPFMAWTTYEGMRQLLVAGGEVHARRGAGRTLHSKYVVVDDEWVTIGSHNLDYYSARYCCETNLLTRDARLAAALVAFFQTGIADAAPVLLAEAHEVCRRAHGPRAFDRVFRDFQ